MTGRCIGRPTARKTSSRGRGQRNIDDDPPYKYSISKAARTLDAAVYPHYGDVTGEEERPKRHKRAKRVFDPSESTAIHLNGTSPHPSSSALHHLSPPLSYDTAPSTYRGGKRRTAGGVFGGGAAAGMQGDECYICRSYSTEHGDEFILRCTTCSTAGHPSCLGYSAVLAERSKRHPWTCMDCKHCTVCDMDHVVGTLIFCDECDRAYHLTCHIPALTTQPQGAWVCCLCRGSPNNILVSSFEASSYSSSQQQTTAGFPLTPRDSPILDDESRGSSGSWQGGGAPPAAAVGGVDPSIPLVLHWTVEEVVKYFQEKGFSQEAQVFTEQAIDGSALLLLSRNDVLYSFGLKIGPAVKLHRQIRILQTRLPNPPTHV